MTKQKFLDLCIIAAVKRGRYFRFLDVPWEKSELVTHKGALYVPEKLMIGFGRDGCAIYSARIRDVKAKYSYVEVRLEELKGASEDE